MQGARHQRLKLDGALTAADVHAGRTAAIVHAVRKAEAGSVEAEELAAIQRAARRVARAVGSVEAIELEADCAIRQRRLAGGVPPSPPMELHGMDARAECGRNACQCSRARCTDGTWGDADPHA